MKKLMSLMAAIGLVSSTGTLFSNVVSCSKAKPSDEVKTLTYKEGKNDRSFVEVLENKTKIGNDSEGRGLLVDQNKLQRDYLDKKNESDEVDFGKYEGSAVYFTVDKTTAINNEESNEDSRIEDSFPNYMKEIFNELNDFKNKQVVNKTEKRVTVDYYFMTIKGVKDSSEFTTFIYNFKLDAKLPEENPSQNNVKEKLKGESTLMYKKTITIS